VKIEILGTGCTKCIALLANVEQAVAQIGGFHQIEKVDDMMKIMEYGVMNTPGLVVDGEVKSTGKLLTVAQCKEVLESC
jgi:small redox-active disulfide protein 2